MDLWYNLWKWTQADGIFYLFLGKTVFKKPISLIYICYWREKSISIGLNLDHGVLIILDLKKLEKIKTRFAWAF